jgi:MFS family permease
VAPRFRSLADSYGGLLKLLALVSAVVFVETMFYYAIVPLLPHYAHRFGLSKAGAGILVGCYPIGTLLGTLPGGAYASKVGMRRTVVAGLVLMCAATLAFGFAGSAVLADCARFVQGVGGAWIWTGGLAWLASEVPTGRRAQALGVAIGAAIAGALFGPVVGAVASRVGTGPTFSVASVVGTGLIVASLLIAAPPPQASQPIRQALLAVKDPNVAIGAWVTFIGGLAFGIVDVLAPLRLNRLGASAIVIGAAFLGSAALEAALSPVIGRIADRRGALSPIRVCVTGAILVSVLLPFASPAALLVVLIVVGLPMFGLLFVPSAAIISDAAHRNGLHQGLGFALWSFAWAAGQGSAAISGGAVAQATSDGVCYAILAVIFAVTLLLMRRKSGVLLPSPG